MAFDVIVFNQEELQSALARGVKSIALCDNSFTLPDISGIEYTIIGNVTIGNADKPEEKKEEEIPAYANVEHKMMAYSSSFDSSFTSSFASSFGGGYSENGSFALSTGGLGSFSSSAGGSYNYEYGYEYGSFSSSFAAEFTSSYQTPFISSYYSFISGMTFGFGSGSFSFIGSFSGSYAFGYGYSFSTSYAGSYGMSFVGSYAPLEDIIEYGSSGIIFVNGYGINLI